jgi:hypothetical protein
MKPIIIISLCLIFFSSCNSRKFETNDQFKKWVEGKTFTSKGNDLDQYDSHGNYHSPVGTLELKFDGDKLTYQGCPPQNYNVYQDENDWVVGFKSCDDNDLFELVIPASGDMYVRSLDYDLSHMEEGSSSSAVNKLDAIVSKKVTKGPTMEITEEHEVIPLTKAHIDSATKADSTVVIPDSPKVGGTNEVKKDTVQKIQIKEMQPIGNDTTPLIAQINGKDSLSDKLPLSYRNGNTRLTFSRTSVENIIKLDCYNETGLYATFDCEQQGVFLYVKGTQDIFSCGAGKVHWFNRNTNVQVQLYQVK